MKIDPEKIELIYGVYSRILEALRKIEHFDDIEAIIQMNEYFKGEAVFQDETEAVIDDALTDLKGEVASEEMREALKMLLAKAIINSKRYTLDFIFPDLVGFLLYRIVETIIPEKSIVTHLGAATGNVLNIIANLSQKELYYTAVQPNEELARLIAAMADLQGNNISVFCNETTDPLLEPAQLLIGGFASREKLETELKTHLPRLPRGTYFAYLIDPDFFRGAFQEQFPGSVLGLIVLSAPFFKGEPRAILFGTNEPDKNRLQVLELKSDKKKDMLGFIQKFDKLLKEIKEDAENYGS